MSCLILAEVSCHSFCAISLRSGAGLLVARGEAGGSIWSVASLAPEAIFLLTGLDGETFGVGSMVVLSGCLATGGMIGCEAGSAISFCDSVGWDGIGDLSGGRRAIFWEGRFAGRF